MPKPSHAELEERANKFLRDIDEAARGASNVVEFNAKTKVWLRQPKESSQAFEAFQKYVELKEVDGKCSIGDVAAALGKHVTLMNRWQKQHKWFERYRAYENHLLLMEERERERLLRRKAQEWVGRRVEIRETGYDVGQQLIDRAKLLLSLPVADREVKKVVKAASGEEIAVVTNLIFQQSPRDARLLAETGIKLMRLSADMATENFGLPAGEDIDNMDEAQLDEYITRLQNFKQQQVEDPSQ